MEIRRPATPPTVDCRGTPRQYAVTDDVMYTSSDDDDDDDDSSLHLSSLNDDVDFDWFEFEAQGQYWAGRTPPPNNPPPNMAAANFVVITNGEGCALNGTAVAAVWSTNSVPRAFFPRVAIGCRLSLKIDRNLSPSWAGGLSVATWYDTAWIGGTASG